MRQHRAIAATLTNLLKQGGAQVDKERPAPHMYELETNDKGERVVKEAILDLALNFPGQLCTHWIDVSVGAPLAERYSTQGCGLRYHGRGGHVEALQGKGTPDGDGDVWKAGPGVGAAGQTARARPVLHVWKDRLRRALWCRTAG